MTASLGSATSGAHRWQDVTVLVISIAGIRSNSGLAGSKTSGAHHWQVVTMLATPIVTKASGLGPRKVLRVLLSTPTSREIKMSKAIL